MTRVWIGIDDTCPALDGQAPPRFEILDGLVERFPGIKFTHFVPAGYSLRSGLWWALEKRARRMVGAGPGTRPDPGALLSRHPEWIRRFARRSAFQAELHGMFHVDFASGDAREFAALDRDQALARVDAGLAEFERAGFPPPAVLAPPGWAVTPALLEALAKRNLALAGSFIGPDGVRRAGLPLARPWRPEVQQGVMQLPRHCSIERFDPAGLDSLVGLGAVIGFHAHYRSFGVRNSLTPANLSGLARSLEHLGQTGPVEFCFARELAAVVPR